MSVSHDSQETENCIAGRTLRVLPESGPESSEEGMGPLPAANVESEKLSVWVSFLAPPERTKVRELSLTFGT